MDVRRIDNALARDGREPVTRHGAGVTICIHDTNAEPAFAALLLGFVRRLVAGILGNLIVGRNRKARQGVQSNTLRRWEIRRDQHPARLIAPRRILDAVQEIGGDYCEPRVTAIRGGLAPVPRGDQNPSDFR
jgi:hypothetical protein